jgi:glycosyltransferase involved in cell wall biosynthesis
MITDGETGFLVAERDVAAYCQKLTQLLADDGTLGKAASKVVQTRFDQQLQARKLHAVYDELIQHPMGAVR